MPEFRPILQSMAAEMFRRITAATHSEQPKDAARPALKKTEEGFRQGATTRLTAQVCHNLRVCVA